MPMSSDHLPRNERRALRLELAQLHRLGKSDYSMAAIFKVSPGAVNKLRLHGYVGKRVAAAIYLACGLSRETLLERYPPPAPTPGCSVCAMERPKPNPNELTTIRLCPAHALEVHLALLG